MEPNRRQSIDGFNRRPAAGIPAGRPHQRPANLMSDFGQPHAAVVPVQNPTPMQPTSVPVQLNSRPSTESVARPYRQSTQPVVTSTAPQSSILQPTPAPLQETDNHVLAKPEDILGSTLNRAPSDQPDQAPKQAKSGHPGLVGLTVFIVLTALYVLPILPGKMLDNFPGSSVNSSSGEQSFACLKQPTNVTSSDTTSGKVGFPIAYKYTTTTRQQATCASTSQTIVAARVSQFNPIGLGINVILALVISLITGTLWGVLYRRFQR